MKVERIDLHRAPGMARSFFLDELAPGINVIVGPNGSGKTSLCRALQGLFWPELPRSGSLEVEARCVEGTDTFRAERINDRVEWQRNGTTVDAPKMPDVHIARCYSLGMRDLMQDERQTDETVTRDILREMSGGYDPEEVAEEFRPRRKRPQEFAAWKRAATAVREIETRFRDLAGDETRLVDLERAREEARRAGDLRARLEEAIQLAEARAQQTKLAAERAEFAPALASCTGEEETRLQEAEQARQKAAEEIRECEEKLRQAKKEIEASAISSEPAAEDLEAWQKRSTALLTQEVSASNLNQQAEEARGKQGAARSALSGSADIDSLPTLSAEDLAGLAALVNQRQQSAARIHALDAKIALLGDQEEAEASAVDPADEARRLREWLVASPGESSRMPILLACGLFVIALVAAAALGEWQLLAGGVATLLLLSPVLYRGLRFHGDARRRIESALRADHAESLATMNRRTVLERLQELDTAIARRELVRVERARAREFEAERKHACEELNALAEKRDALAKRIGVHADDDLPLLVLAEKIRHCAESDGLVAGLDEAGRALRKEIAAILADATTFFSAYGSTNIRDGAALAAAVEALRQKTSDLREAKNEVARSSAARDKAQKAAEEANERITALCRKFDLDSDDRDGLLQQLSGFADWKRVDDEYRGVSRDIARLEAALADHPELLAMGAEEIRESAAENLKRAEQRDKLGEEITDIKGRVRDARNDARMEAALAEREQTHNALEELRDIEVHNAAARFLLDSILADHEKTSRPPVLTKASEYFAAFTRDNYSLIPPRRSTEEFRARDNQRAEDRALSELSDGTRIQLLLAVRLAFAIHAEGPRKLPILLDEALSTADPERFEAIADSLTLLASEGRQIFYLTSNPADATAWQQIGEASASGKPRIHYLDEAQAEQAAEKSTEALAGVERRICPAPGDHSMAEYGRLLNVPPIDLAGPVEALHPFYLLDDDTELLYRMVKDCRLSYVGQWESLSHSGRAERFFDAKERGTIDARAQIARAVFASRAIGRGARVDQDILEATGAVSETYLARLAAIARDHDGDALALIETLESREDERSKGFQSRLIERLASDLETKGHIDRSPRLTAAEIRTRVVADVAPNLVAAGMVTYEDCHALVDRLLAGAEQSAGAGKD